MAPAPRFPPLPWALIASACLAMFATSSSGATRSPFLLDMARDLDVSLSLTANIMAMTSISWGVASLIAGPLSDRHGRRPFLIGGAVGLALGTVGVAASASFAGVAFSATAAGAAAGCLSTAMVTEVSSRVEDRQRGRALGWVLSGQSMALLLGVPMAAFAGAHIGWRGVNLCVAAIVLLSALGLFLTTRRPVAVRAGPRTAAPSYRGALTPVVLRLLCMGVAERTCYALGVVFFATFLQAAHGVTVAALALPLAIFATGNILGTVLGGQLADRLGNRLLVYAGALLCCAAAALPLFLWAPALWVSVAFGFAFTMASAVSRPALMASLSNVPDEVRGTVLGLNVTASSFGWLFGAALGGVVVALWGFGGFAPLAAGFALLGAALAFGGIRRRA